MKYCTNCGTTAAAQMPGSGWIEFALYFIYFFPGIFYSLWRRRESARVVCPKCHQPSMIPLDSPLANKPLLDELRARLTLMMPAERAIWLEQNERFLEKTMPPSMTIKDLLTQGESK